MSDTLYITITALMVLAGIISLRWAAHRRSSQQTLSVGRRWEDFDDDELACIGYALSFRIRNRPPLVDENGATDRMLYESLQREVAYRHAVATRSPFAQGIDVDQVGGRVA